MSEQTIYLEIFQPFAQYRNPFTFYYAQSFPLPPKSTVIGMLQNACDDWYGHKNLEEWKNLKVSIHGGCESIFWNYQQLIKGNIEIENG
ncbi:MAG: CRISPR-associated protein Cas5, partial [Candidatus Woesearchaeota archaeon]